jgi:hypothetical protein
MLGTMLLALALCSIPVFQAQALETPKFLQPAVKPMEIGFDVMIVRPLSITTVIIGAALFVPAFILSAPNFGSNSYDDMVETFITIPYESTFNRPLGDF